MKALLATPLHTGSAEREFINGLLEAHGLYAGWTCLEGQANISRARDLLAAQFLASDCTTLVFIDGDIGFTRADLERLLASPFAITGGLYPRKSASLKWVCAPQPEDLPPVPGHPDYRRVRRMGTGFLRIERSAFEKMVAHGQIPDYPMNEGRIRHFFPTGMLNGEFLSEDYYFCELAAQAGLGVYLDTRIRLRHVGRSVYRRADDAER
ncbi:hypothetical protein HNQ60_000823 [Povalibacter uvarum]|uniref:Glycosyltransferase n=1 Tax=Povalibacter uvarum TaxID=732238 RepID=A0A841HGF0_9GAMM|nr:hypothetical protein [Povalibacter uvarum]MBB6091977.1 hypothetical protein [Povalibacter uvarum]